MSTNSVVKSLCVITYFESLQVVWELFPRKLKKSLERNRRTGTKMRVVGQI